MNRTAYYGTPELVFFLLFRLFDQKLCSDGDRRKSSPAFMPGRIFTYLSKTGVMTCPPFPEIVIKPCQQGAIEWQKYVLILVFVQ
jgi:hypothetical protein